MILEEDEIISRNLRLRQQQARNIQQDNAIRGFPLTVSTVLVT
jgi:hypothetical protein